VFSWWGLCVCALSCEPDGPDPNFTVFYRPLARPRSHGSWTGPTRLCQILVQEIYWQTGGGAGRVPSKASTRDIAAQRRSPRHASRVAIESWPTTGSADVEVNDLAAVMRQKPRTRIALEKRSRRHEEVDGGDVSGVVLEEGSPGLLVRAAGHDPLRFAEMTNLPAACCPMVQDDLRPTAGRMAP